uniref:Uncharacterized protein n=1 Tax=Anguilla anguilla TaxID=7936 RepID=A0A0E9R0N3_ANGAN
MEIKFKEIITGCFCVTGKNHRCSAFTGFRISCYGIYAFVREVDFCFGLVLFIYFLYLSQLMFLVINQH